MSVSDGARRAANLIAEHVDEILTDAPPISVEACEDWIALIDREACAPLRAMAERRRDALIALEAEVERLKGQVSDLLQEREDAGHEASVALEAARKDCERLRAALGTINEIALRESCGGRQAPDAYGTIGRLARAALEAGR